MSEVVLLDVPAPDPFTAGLVDGFCADCYPHGLAPGKTSDELVEEFRGWLRAGVAASKVEPAAGALDG
jgi:hypothetical protein